MCCRPASSGATDGSSRPRSHSARSLICIAQASAMLMPSIFDDRAASLSRLPPHSGQAREGDDPLDERPDVRLHRVDVLGQHRLLDLRDQSLVGQVDALDLDLGRLLVEEVMELGLGEVADRLVRVEEAAAAEDAAVPAVHAVAGDLERALVERLAVVVQLGQVDVVDRAHALAARTHAAVVDARRARRRRSRLARARRSIAPLAVRVGDVEREGGRRADVGLPRRLKRIRSIALASVAVPTVERALAPIRSWSTMIAVVSPRGRRRRAGRACGMKPCTKAL